MIRPSAGLPHSNAGNLAIEFYGKGCPLFVGFCGAILEKPAVHTEIPDEDRRQTITVKPEVRSRRLAVHYSFQATTRKNMFLAMQCCQTVKEE